MKKLQNRTLLVSAIALVVYLAVALAVPFPKTPAFWIAFAFGLIAIVAQVCVMRTAFDGEETVKSKIYGFPIARIGIIWLIVQIVASFTLMGLGFAFPVPAWASIVVCAVVTGIFAVGLIGADVARDEVERQDEKQKQTTTVMRELQAKTAFLATQCADPDTKAALTALADKFRYSDPVSSDALTGIEGFLASIVDDLHAAVRAGDLDSAKTLCAKAASTLDERNTMCKLGK